MPSPPAVVGFLAKLPLKSVATEIPHDAALAPKIPLPLGIEPVPHPVFLFNA